MDLTAIYLQRLDILADLIANVKDDQLGDPTPCDGFDVRDLINHVLGDTMGLARGALGEKVESSSLIGAGTDHIADLGGVVQAAARVRDLSHQAWTRPGVTEGTFPIGDGMPGKLALRIALLEAVVHGWDIAKATHQAYEIPEQLAAPMLEGFRKTVGDERPDDGFFGPAVPVPEDATAADKLIAYTGRRP